MSQAKEISQTESDVGNIAKKTLHSILDPEQHGDFDKNMQEMDQALTTYDKATEEI